VNPAEALQVFRQRDLPVESERAQGFREGRVTLVEVLEVDVVGLQGCVSVLMGVLSA
jgi:hypothetical protein